MSDSITNPELYLNAQEKHAYRELFKLADVEQKSFLGKQEAMTFFSNTGIPSAFLEEIWQSGDEGDKEYITETEFYVALKLIACAQNGVEAVDNILSTPVSLPQFRGITIGPVGDKSLEIGPITANEREKYIGVFQSCNLVDGLLYGDEARNIFIRSRLPMDKLNSIWLLADTRNSGTLNKTEFIIAMHYISRLMSNPSLVLPQTLPSQTYAEATGRFATSIRRHNTMASPVMRNRATSNASLGFTSPVISHMTGSSTSFSTNGLANSSISSKSVALSPQEIEQYKPYFHELDTDGSGFIDSEEAVYFFSHSRLPDSELGIIWEIADSRHLGKLDLHDFSVAMHLINIRKNGESIERYHHLANNFIQQQPYNPSPVISNQQIIKQNQQVDLNQRYELENQLVEIKQQVNSQNKLVDTYRTQQKEERNTVAVLESEVAKAKNELEAAKKTAADAEKLLELDQQKRDELLGEGKSSASSSTTQSNTPNATFVSSLPELTRAPSTFSGSSVMSPRSDNGSVPVFDPFAGFKKSQATAAGVPPSPRIVDSTPKKMSLSPVQAKAVSKYGFDITAFDALSLTDNTSSNTYQKSSVNDDLASLFGSPSITNNTTTSIVTNNPPQSTSSNSNFDSIFM